MSRFIAHIPVPSMGATVHEITVIDLFAEVGQEVVKGERIAELESDKSVFDYEAPANGKVVGWVPRPGDVVPTNSPLLELETEDPSLRHLAKNGKKAEVPVTATVEKKAHQTPPVQASQSAGAVVSTVISPEGPKWTPRAIKLAREAGLQPGAWEGLTSTGPGGRVSGDDVARWLAEKATQPEKKGASDSSSGTTTVQVAGIGYAVPNNLRSNKEILKAFPEMTEDEIVRITGIKTRYYATEEQSARDLAAEASRHALAMAGMEPGELDGIIMATILPDQPVPSAASDLARHLGAAKALTFDLNAACSGWLYALEVGRTFIKGGTAQKLLVVTAELLSRITNPKDHATAFLFGDGAGAAILTAEEGGHRLDRMKLSGDANFYQAIQREGGGARHPFPQKDDFNLDNFYLSMDGPVVFKQAVRAFGDIIEETMQRHGLSPEEVSWIVPHQANERILRAVSKRVGISYERFVVTIGKYGNTSAASVSMALGWAAEEGIFETGDHIIFCSVGAGFTFAGGLLTW
ncbi:MAG: beta-ketoacyl-ACP synthase 3 [Opitutales bacterium]|nr:beta-ketoacyl-ACP synthase 3 [Opitutales bacterium]MCH8541592.1 beta-ketoacyl-ACP synthase 3 [Opitutales bacterium]